MSLLREDGYLRPEERAPEEPWPRRVLLPRVALFLAWGSLLMVLLYPLSFLSWGISPCQVPGWERQSAFLTTWTGFGLVAFLLFRAARHHSPRRFAAAILLLALSQGWNAYSRSLDDHAQRQCALRTADEAMAWCRADPAVYVRSVSIYGSPLLRLVAPGTTNRPWQCLMDWMPHQAREPAWSIEVDESVYGPRRR